MQNTSTFIIATLYLSAINLYAAPSGSEVISGVGSVSHSDTTTTINQSSQNLSLTWDNFNIAPNETVNFIQPSSSAIAINRIYSTDGTQILGHLNANGQVYLINPNGILFGRGSQVNVGALVASTLEMNDNMLNDSIRYFSGSNPNTIINQGTITATDGGYIALIGNHVSNEGIITAHLGSVVLGSGSTVRLTFDGNSLIGMEVEHSLLDSLSENGGLIRADGGQIIMSAGAKDALRVSVVNNTGVIEARSVENRNGTIILLGGMEKGIVTVGGVLDASAPDGGNGGSIETSGAHVMIANDARITTASAFGTNGTWLIDPVDFTVASSGGDITGTLLGTLLNSNSITIQSIDGMTGTNGDITINDAISWAANTILTLKADRTININKSISASGTSGKLALEYGQAAIAAGNTSDYTVNAPVNLSAGLNFSTKLGSDGITKIYTVITDLGVAGSMSTIDLQGINGALNGNYALGSNIDATGTNGWNVNAGFTPIGYSAPFGGTFDGLGHSITDLSINTVTTYQGLFGITTAGAMIRDVGVVNANIIGTAHIGGLVGNNAGTIINSYVSGNVTGTSPVGGLVGSNTGAVSHSHASVNVIGTSTLGGLLGSNTGVISDSYATGSVSGSTTLGGLIGSNTNTVYNAYATGNIIGTTTMGGLMGSNTGNIHDTYATGNVNGTTTLGGLLGSNTGAVSNSYSVGNVSGTTTVGGLVGSNTGTLLNSYWDTTTSNQLTSAGGIGMSTADMQLQSNFTTWDFASVWLMYDGITYPLLRSLMTPLVVSATNVVKTYDKIGFSGGDGVTYSITPTLMPDGTITYSGDSQGALNVGSYTLTLSGLRSNQHYLVSYADGSLDITPKSLTVTATAADKVYDATTAASATLASSDIISGDIVTFGGSATFADKNVGVAKTVTVGTLVASGADAPNYSITNTTATDTADITAAPQVITNEVITVQDKIDMSAPTEILTNKISIPPNESTIFSIEMDEYPVFDTKYLEPDRLITFNGYYTLTSISADTDTNILFNGESIDAKSKSYCGFNYRPAHKHTARKKHPLPKMSVLRPKLRKLPLKTNKRSLSSKLDSLCWHGSLNNTIISTMNNLGTTEPLLYRLEYYDK